MTVVDSLEAALNGSHVALPNLSSPTSFPITAQSIENGADYDVLVKQVENERDLAADLNCMLRSHVLLHCRDGSSHLSLLVDEETQIQQDGVFVEIQSTPVELVCTRPSKRIRLESENHAQAAGWVQLFQHCIQSCNESCSFPRFEALPAELALPSEQNAGTLVNVQCSTADVVAPKGMEHDLIEQLQNEARVAQEKIQGLTEELDLAKEENLRLQTSVDEQVRKIGDSINLFRQQKQLEVVKLQQQVCKLSAQLVQTHFNEAERTKDHQQASALLTEIQELTATLTDVPGIDKSEDKQEDSTPTIAHDSDHKHEDPTTSVALEYKHEDSAISTGRKKKGVTFSEELLPSPTTSPCGGNISPDVQSSTPTETEIPSVEIFSSAVKLVQAPVLAHASPLARAQSPAPPPTAPMRRFYAGPPGPSPFDSTLPVSRETTPRSRVMPAAELTPAQMEASPLRRARTDAVIASPQQLSRAMSLGRTDAGVVASSPQLSSRLSLGRRLVSPGASRQSSLTKSDRQWVTAALTPRGVQVAVLDATSGTSTPTKRSLSPAMGYRSAYQRAVHSPAMPPNPQFLRGSVSPAPPVSSPGVLQQPPVSWQQAQPLVQSISKIDVSHPQQQATPGQVVPQVAAQTASGQAFQPMSRSLPFLR